GGSPGWQPRNAVPPARKRPFSGVRCQPAAAALHQGSHEVPAGKVAPGEDEPPRAGRDNGVVWAQAGLAGGGRARSHAALCLRGRGAGSHPPGRHPHHHGGRCNRAARAANHVGHRFLSPPDILDHEQVICAPGLLATGYGGGVCPASPRAAR
nr:hypothetical protein [Tanacetum cinerariifolium]